MSRARSVSVGRMFSQSPCLISQAEELESTAEAFDSRFRPLLPAAQLLLYLWNRAFTPFHPIEQRWVGVADGFGILDVARVGAELFGGPRPEPAIPLNVQEIFP